MKPDPENIIERGRLIAELGLKLIEEKERYELLKSESELARYVACQELEKFKREYFNLKEKMNRVVEDYNILRERELKDQDKIKGLLVEIERKEIEFKDKFVELKLENRDVECGNRKAMSEVSEWKKKFAELEDKVSMLVDEIVRRDIETKMLLVEKKDLASAKKRAEDEAHEWMNKYTELQARESRLNDEITQLKVKEKEGFDDELPKRSADPLEKSHRVDSLLTPEQRSTPIVVVDSDDEGDVGGGDDIGDENDRITVRQGKRRKDSNLIDVAKEASSLRKVGKSGAKKTANKVSKVSDAQTLSLQEKKAVEEQQPRESRLNEEITRLKEKEQEGFDYELPKRSADPLQKSQRVDFPLTPDQRSKRRMVVDSDDEGEVGSGDEDDRITLSWMKRRKHSDLIDAAKEASSLCKVGKSGAKKTCNMVNKVRDAQTLSSQEKKELEVADTGIQTVRKRKPYSGSIGSGPQFCALRRAEELRSNLKSSRPSFIRSMVKSHVRSTFWLSLPFEFCKENLPADKLKMVLEDEKGSEYNVVYIGEKNSFSGGWRGFALAHHLELGDALIFELCEPTRFKVYIIKANLESSKGKDSDERIS